MLPPSPPTRFDRRGLRLRVTGLVLGGAVELLAVGELHAQTSTSTASRTAERAQDSPRRGGLFGFTEAVDEASDVPRFGDYSTGDAEVLGVSVGFNGYIRLAAEVVESSEIDPNVGRSDGFKLANARLGLQARKGPILAYVSVEGGAGEAEGESESRAFRVRPRDAFMRFELSRFALLTAGRFKSPYDLGSLKAIVRRSFIDRSIESRGVLSTQGRAREGLAQGRQLGVMIHRDRIGLNDEGFDLGYALAITNGRTDAGLFNDNDFLAAFSRLSFQIRPWGTLQVAGFVDRRTGEDLGDTMGAEASVILEGLGFYFEGQFLFQTTRRPDSAVEDQRAYGAHAQLTYALGPFELGYRFALLEPSAEDLDNADRLIEHAGTFVLRLRKLPIVFMINGTLVVEEVGQRLANNRLAALGQFRF